MSLKLNALRMCRTYAVKNQNDNSYEKAKRLSCLSFSLLLSRVYRINTGAVKITPAHDQNDYECGKRNNLPFITMIDDNGMITGDCGPFTVSLVTFNISYLSIT